METRSRSSLSALTKIGFQKRSIARGVCPYRSSQCAKDCPVSRCVVSVSGSSARAIASLSAAFKNGKRRNEGTVCNGAGNGDVCITDARPPGSTNVIWWYQRIRSCTPSSAVHSTRMLQQRNSTCWQLSMISPVPGCSYDDALPPRNGRFSKRVTRSPASASAHAAARPARPPPATATVGCVGLEVIRGSLTSLHEAYQCLVNQRRMTDLSHHNRRCRNPLPRIRSFSETVRLTLPLNTSY